MLILYFLFCFLLFVFFVFFFWLNLEPSIFPTHPLATWARPQGHIANTCRAAIFHSPVFPSLFLLSVTCKTEIFGRLWSCIPLTLNYWDIIFSLVNNLVASMSCVYMLTTLLFELWPYAVVAKYTQLSFFECRKEGFSLRFFWFWWLLYYLLFSEASLWYQAEFWISWSSIWASAFCHWSTWLPDCTSSTYFKILCLEICCKLSFITLQIITGYRWNQRHNWYLLQTQAC